MKNLFKITIAFLMTVGSFAQERPDAPRNIDIDNYKIHIENRRSSITQRYLDDVKRSEHLKPTEKPKDLKKKTIWNVSGWKENERIEAQQKVYDNKIYYAKESRDNRMRVLMEYQQSWVEYERSERKKIADKAEAERLAKAKKRLEIMAETERRLNEALQKEEDEKLREAEYKTMPTNPSYLAWKSKYESALSQSQKNKDRCEALIIKNRYRNAFGQYMYDPSDFSQADRKAFITNIESMGVQHEKIRELENEKEYLGYWNNKHDMKKSTQSYSLSMYYNNKRYTFY